MQAVLFVDSPTEPAKPCKLVTVAVEVPTDPALTLTLVGLADIVKSCTVKVMTIE